MEMVHHETPSKVSPQVGEDVISSMPEDVIANIMDRLPLQDAVGTSILSTSWRFKYTLLIQLIFDENFFFSLHGHFDKINIIISRLLFHLRGAVTKFSLFINNDIKLDDKDIRHWVMLLSRLRGFKELTLMNCRVTPVKLPTHLFSCLELKHLCLHNCVLPPSPYSRGFPKLLSLTLLNVRLQDHKCGELIAQCPLLETLEILNSELKGEVKLVEIAKLQNVKMLGLSLCLLDNITMVSVFQHMSLLPKLQELYLSFRNSKFLLDDVAQNPVFTAYPFLKTLALWEMYLSGGALFSNAFGILFDRVNLQTLKIKAICNEAGREPDTKVDCYMIEQMQLLSVLLTNIKGNENEVRFIKSILARSPFLNTITIDPQSTLIFNAGDVKFWFVNKLLRFPRVSRTAVIAIRGELKPNRKRYTIFD